MTEIMKTPLTFEDIKRVAKDNSELNMLMDGTTYGATELLTPKSYLSALVQLRTAKGQNANSILTEKDIEEKGYYPPAYDFAFYNNENEKCYDFALIPNKGGNQGKDLHFEETLGQTLASAGLSLDSTKPDIEKNSFDNFNQQMAKTFGIEMNIDTTYSVYDAKFFRSLGRRVVNLFAGKDGRLKSTGTLFIAKPDFVAEEGSPERLKEESDYYRSCVMKYTDLLTEQMTHKISFSDYEKKLISSPEFEELSKKEQKEQLKFKKDLFKYDATIFDNIARDLVASEIVKTMPNLSAKMRYELNQAYILRACQSLASLGHSFENDTIIIKVLQDAVKQPILSFNKRLNLTPEQVAGLNAQVLQMSPDGVNSLEEAIFGDKKQLFVKSFGYKFSPRRIMTMDASSSVPLIDSPEKDKTVGLETTSERLGSKVSELNAGDTKTNVSASPVVAATIPKDEKTDSGIATGSDKSQEVVEQNNKAQNNKAQTKIEDFYNSSQDYNFSIEDLGNTPTTSGGESVAVVEGEATVKNKEENLKPSHNPPYLRDEKTVDVASLPQKELADMVDDYIDCRISKAISHVAKYAELNDDGRHAKAVKLFNKVRDGYCAEKVSGLTEDEERLLSILNNERERFVSNFMEDWDKYKADYEQGKNNGEWLQAKSIPALLKRWMQDPTTESSVYQNGLKTFRGNYERYIRNGVSAYANSFAKVEEIEKGIEK